MKDILTRYGLSEAQIVKLDGYDSKNFRVIRKQASDLVIKLYPIEELNFVRAEIETINFLNKKLEYSLPSSISGFDIETYDDQTFSRVIPFIEGTFLSKRRRNHELIKSFGRFTGKLLSAFKNYQNSTIEVRRNHWDLKLCLLNSSKRKHVKDQNLRSLIDYYFDRFEHGVLPKIEELRWSIIHNDLNDNNVITKNDQIEGIIDFGDMVCAPLINEVAIALTYLLFEQDEPLSIAHTFCAACHAEFKLEKKEIAMLYDLIAARLSVSLVNSAAAKAKNKDSAYILVSEKPAKELLTRWIRIHPKSFTNGLFEACGYAVANATTDIVKSNRSKNFPANLSLSYDDTIHMDSAAFQFMFDAEGNTYLDAYNNIPHVGHCHPRISRVIDQQVRKLNTNTRYHFDLLSEYSEDLLSYFPANLNKLMLVNSGSAASDLAVKLAMNYNSSHDVLVLEHGYHGNSRLGIEISSYKFQGKGGHGKKDHIHVLPLPKEFNGKSGEEYALDAIMHIQQLIEQGIHPACFIFESISGCGGQVPLAEGYLGTLVPFLKEQGILCISDEVQVGFGRMGSHFWGFEFHEVIPDMVVLGKPIGNGHPMAAVICTNEIAERVAHSNSMEFFSSFGGNPVSCAIGLEVLQIIKEEELQRNSLLVGKYWKEQLNQLKAKFPVIGDVRGQGLFIGIEFVQEDGLRPNTPLAQKVKNELRNRFILSSTDGPHDNVMKCKPPLCFTRDNANEFCENFEAILLKKLH